jgi:pimeloyl-ACP methyl ester carboxylesterase
MCSSLTSDQEKTMTSPLPFVLVHGAWHGAWSYEQVIPHLAALGHASVARDLPAHGLNARFPDSFHQRPINPALFATEPSKVAGTTLDDYVASIEATVNALVAAGHAKVVLVGHSMGGVPITAVAEHMPEKIARLVYLTAFMPASGVPGVSYISAAENEGEMVGPQLMADPAQVGALRMDHRSTDEIYIRNAKLAFYADVSDENFAAAAHLLTPDTPVGPFATPIATTKARWGSVQRHYIKCLQDRAIRPLLQQRFIDEANAFIPENLTQVHEMTSSHSPFLSQPQALAKLLAHIARP